jgi:hypothetical protein
MKVVIVCSSMPKKNAKSGVSSRVPYTFDNLFELLSKESIFDPSAFGAASIVPDGVIPRFPDLLGETTLETPASNQLHAHYSLFDP